MTVTFTSCSGLKNNVNKVDINELHQIVTKEKVEIENNWAYPQGSNNISLIGNPNYIRLNKDSIDVSLPYFGVRQSGGTYGGNRSGIAYNGLMNNLSLQKNYDKGNLELKFEAEQKGENLNFTITMSPTGKTRTHVISNQRTSISYQGNIKQEL